MGRERRKWTPEEDELLRQAVKKAMDKSQPLLWRELAKNVPGRTNKDCRRRWWNSLAEGVMKGPWAESEDERLFNAVREHGTKWNRVAAAVRTRNSDQCSSHWSQTLDPTINYSDWTSDEDERLLQEVAQYGTNWIRIAASHGLNRTTLALKNRYSTLRSKKEAHGSATKSTSPQEARYSHSNSVPRQGQSRFADAMVIDRSDGNVAENSDDDDDSEDDDEQDDLDDDDTIDSSMFMNIQGPDQLLMNNDTQRHSSSANIEPYFLSPTSSLGRPNDDPLSSMVYSNAYPFDFGVSGHVDNSQINGQGHTGGAGPPGPSHSPFQYVSQDGQGMLQAQRPSSSAIPAAAAGQEMVDFGSPRILHRVQIDAECTSERLGNILQSIVGIAKSVTVKVESEDRQR